MSGSGFLTWRSCVEVVVDVNSFPLIRCMCGLVADRGRTRGRRRRRKKGMVRREGVRGWEC